LIPDARLYNGPDPDEFFLKERELDFISPFQSPTLPWQSIIKLDLRGSFCMRLGSENEKKKKSILYRSFFFLIYLGFLVFGIGYMLEFLEPCL